MKTVIILLLVISALLIGCTKEAPEAPEKMTQPSVISDEEAINEVDDSLLSENDEIEIGEVI